MISVLTRLRRLTNQLAQITTPLLKPIRAQWQRRKVLIIAIGIGSLVLLILGLISQIPRSQPFEAELIVQQLTLTTDGTNQRFLGPIDSVPQIGGIGPQTFKLQGTFTTDPPIPLPNTSRQPLEIKLESDDSYWILDTEDDRDLGIEYLLLTRPTQIKDLNFVPQKNRLAFLLKSLDPSTPNRLQINTQSDLKIRLSGYTLPQYRSRSTPLPDTLILTYTPTSPQLYLDLPPETQLDIILPPFNTINPELWLWRDLPLRSLDLDTVFPIQGNDGDPFRYSTILSGTLRVAGKTHKLASDQFLTLADPGIQKLRSMRIIEPADNRPEAFQIRVAGTSSQIDIGIDPHLPITTLRFRTIDLSTTVVTNLISFCTGLILTLLIEILTDTDAKPP